MTEPTELKPETVDSAIIVTHLDGTKERFPVKLTRVPTIKHEEKR